MQKGGEKLTTPASIEDSGGYAQRRSLMAGGFSRRIIS
jgi:hypothetical protein